MSTVCVCVCLSVSTQSVSQSVSLSPTRAITNHRNRSRKYHRNDYRPPMLCLMVPSSVPVATLITRSLLETVCEKLGPLWTFTRPDPPIPFILNLNVPCVGARLLRQAKGIGRREGVEATLDGD